MLGYFFSKPLPHLLGIDPRWGIAGLTFSAGLAAWLEYSLLRRAMNQRIGAVDYPASRVLRLWIAAILAGALCFLLHRHLPVGSHLWGHGSRAALLTAIAVLIPYGVLYVAFTVMMRIPIPGSLLRRFKRS